MAAAGRRYYPIFLDVAARRVAVIGGGRVAERKVRQLLACGARVTVISPALTPRLRAWRRRKKIFWKSRGYRRGDLDRMWLVVAATDQSPVNRTVSIEAARRKVWVNVVDDPARSSAIAPAWFRRGPLVVAFSTGGASPALARQLRLKLSREIGRDYAAYVAFLARVRHEVHRRVRDAATRQKLMRRLVRANLLPLLKRGKLGELRRQIARLTSSSPARGGGG
ncbi:MAG: bifunctional precorrin-2 dehydrogenase/sirohydrochlorin ferrochelatase [Nitrospirota bacterium]